MASLTENRLRGLNDLAERLAEHSNRFRIERYLTPLNRDELEESLRNSTFDASLAVPEPRYESPPRQGLADATALLESIDGSRSFWHRLAAEEMDFTVGMWAFLQRRDAKELERITVSRYGLPSPETVAIARSILDAPEHLDKQYEKSLSSSEAASFLRERLARVNLRDWRVIVEDRMSSRMSVSSANAVVRVRAGLTFTSGEVDRLVVHELGTHVLRAVNGSRQRLRLLSLGLGDYLATEEGLAIWHEEHFGYLRASDLRRYALRVLGVEVSRRVGMAAAAKELSRWAAPEDVAPVVLRAKRGVGDASAAGAHVKDHVYLSGFLAVRERIERDPAVYRYLMAAKCALSQVPALKDLEQQGYLRDPDLLPEDILSTT
ncbi:MAG: DUF1704 domain-containing protein [Microthrixaceae bacterium]|nr:DUF1704 domain-containing protein [Microthrixaceae bacterium]